MAGVANHYMVEHFDLQKLTGADEVAGDLDVGFARRRIAAYSACGISGRYTASSFMPHGLRFALIFLGEPLARCGIKRRLCYSPLR